METPYQFARTIRNIGLYGGMPTWVIVLFSLAFLEASVFLLALLIPSIVMAIAGQIAMKEA